MGEASLRFSRDLGDSCRDLSLAVGMDPHDIDRLRPGDEAIGILKWLAHRGRLSKLPGALAMIGRDDLVDVAVALVADATTTASMPDLQPGPPSAGHRQNSAPIQNRLRPTRTVLRLAIVGLAAVIVIGVVVAFGFIRFWQPPQTPVMPPTSSGTPPSKVPLNCAPPAGDRYHTDVSISTPTDGQVIVAVPSTTYDASGTVTPKAHEQIQLVICASGAREYYVPDNNPPTVQSGQWRIPVSPDGATRNAPYSLCALLLSDEAVQQLNRMLNEYRWTKDLPSAGIRQYHCIKVTYVDG
jgi:hypothetical protein